MEGQKEINIGSYHNLYEGQNDHRNVYDIGGFNLWYKGF